jgi:hypothetical protein
VEVEDHPAASTVAIAEHVKLVSVHIDLFMARLFPLPRWVPAVVLSDLVEQTVELGRIVVGIG